MTSFRSRPARRLPSCGWCRWSEADRVNSPIRSRCSRNEMPQEFVYRAFTTTINDPLRLEHEAVAKWVEDALRSLDSASWYRDVELSSLQSGQILLDGKPEQA